MNKLPHTIILIATSILLCFSLPAIAKNDKTFFWEVTNSAAKKDNAIIYLMGSIHFADKSFYPLREEIETAFSQADNLVVEIDTRKIDSKKYHELLSRKGYYKKGITIKDTIEKDTWLKLQQRLNDYNIDYEKIKHYKPGIIVLTLASLHMASLGLEAQHGIDIHFINQADSNNNKNIIAFETLEQQLDLFLNIDDGNLLLNESLDSLEEMNNTLRKIVNNWKLGDVGAMEKILFDDVLIKNPSYDKIYQDLFYNRNKNMVKKISSMLKTNSSYFVVVGTGHLIGPQGIVALLNKKGFIIKRL